MTALELTPHGVVICRDASLSGFTESDAEGLVAVAGQKLKVEADASVGYWKSFGRLFLRALCHVPEGEAVEVP